MKKVLMTIYLSVRWIFLAPFLFFRQVRTPRAEEIKTVLFLRYDRIGDMVASTPLFRAVKKLYPGSRITVLASGRNAPVVVNNPYVDEVLVYSGWSQVRELKKRGFDLVVDLFYTYELKSACLAWLIHRRYVMGFEIWGRQLFFNVKAPGRALEGNMAERLLALGRFLGADVSNPQPEIFLTDAERARARENLAAKRIDLNHSKIGLHPGGFYPTQRWSQKNFIALARILRQEFLAQVLVFCDQDEGGLREIFVKELGDQARVLPHFSLREFAAILAECQLLVCNNSGPLHMAAALGVPTVSLMGPTDAALWSPSGGTHTVLRKDLPCLGCGKSECSHHRCLEEISVQEVVAAVEQQLKRTRRDGA